MSYSFPHNSLSSCSHIHTGQSLLSCTHLCSDTGGNSKDWLERNQTPQLKERLLYRISITGRAAERVQLPATSLTQVGSALLAGSNEPAPNAGSARVRQPRCYANFGVTKYVKREALRSGCEHRRGPGPPPPVRELPAPRPCGTARHRAAPGRRAGTPEASRPPRPHSPAWPAARRAASSAQGRSISRRASLRFPRSYRNPKDARNRTNRTAARYSPSFIHPAVSHLPPRPGN